MISKRDVQLGKIAMQEDMVSKEQVNKCLKIKKKLDTKASLGAILVKKGYITKEQLEVVVSILNEQTKDKKKKKKRDKKKSEEATSEPEETTETTDADADSDDSDDEDGKPEEGEEAEEEPKKKPKPKRRKTLRRTKKKPAEEDADSDESEKDSKSEDEEDEKPTRKKRGSAIRRRRKKRKKEDEETEEEAPIVDKPSEDDSDEDISAVLQSDDDIVDPDVLQSADASEQPSDNSDMMAALLASTLEQSEDDSDDAHQVSDSLFESADITDSVTTVDKRSGKVKRKVLACESCAKKYRIKPKQAGKKFKCRKCGARVAVPADFFDGDEVEEDNSIVEYTGKKQADQAYDEFDLDDLDDEDEEDTGKKKRVVYPTRKHGKRKTDDEEDEKPRTKSYAELVDDALDAPDAPMPVRRMSTANYIQLALSVVVLVSVIGGYFAYANYQEQLRLAKIKKATDAEWSEFTGQSEPTIKKARATLEQARKGYTEGDIETLPFLADQALNDARSLNSVDNLVELLSMGKNPSKASKWLENQKFGTLKTDLQLQAALNWIKCKNVVLQGRATEALEDLVKRDQTNAQAYVLLGHIYTQNRQWKAAFNAIQQALNAKSDSAEALALRGLANEQSQAADEAVKSYSELPTDGVYGTILKARALSQTKPDEAIKEFDAVLGNGEASAEQHTAAAVLKARALIAQKKLDEAVSTLKAAQAKAGELTWAQVELSNALRMKGELDEAVEAVQSIADKGGAPAYLALGRAHLQAGAIASANSAFTQATIVKTTQAMLGPVYLGVDVLEDPLNPFSSRSMAKVEHARLFFLNVQRNRVDVQILKESIDLPSKTDEERAELRKQLAKLLGLTDANLADARLAFAKALELDPWNLVAIAENALFTEAEGDKNRATKQLELSENLTFGSKQSELSVAGTPRLITSGTEAFFRARGIVATARGEFSTADKYFVAILEMDKDNPEYLLRHAKVLSQQKQLETARKRFEAAAKLGAADPRLVSLNSKVNDLEGVETEELEELLNRVDVFLLDNPLSSSAWILKSKIYLRMNKSRFARLAFAKAEAINPADYNVAIAHAKFLLTKAGGEKLAKAVDNLKRAIKFGRVRSKEVYFALAEGLYKVGNFKEALEAANQLILKDALFKPGYALRGKIYQALGKKANAERDFKRANK